MTLRPFSIVYSENSRKGKYHFFDHRGQELAIYKKMPKNFLDKLLSYPITAFGYRFVDLKLADYINPKFDKKDVIKALDFWIEYFVYQNKCDYILENTVNKDFELHLEELIRVREAVLKEPADTKYVRQKIRSTDPYKSQNLIEAMFKSEYERDKELIEFTENVLETSNTPFSTVDQFCYKVKTLTRKKYEKQGKTLYNKDITQSLLGISGDFSAIMNELTRRMVDQVAVTTAPTERPLQMGDLVVYDRESNLFRRAITNDSPVETIRLSTESQTPEFLRWVLTRTFVMPEGTHLISGDMMDIRNDFRDIVIAHGIVGEEELNPGDVVTLVTLNGDSRWRKVINPVDSPNFNPNIPATPALGTRGPDHLLPSSNLHPGMPTEEPQAIGIMFEEGMISNLIGFAGERLGIGDRIYMNRRDGRFYKTPFGRAIEASAISYRVSEIGEMVEAVREATFIYPPGTTPTLYVDDSHLGFDADENVIIRRRLTMN
jgi:hypothetical protein